MRDISFTSYKGAALTAADSCSGELQFFNVTRNAVTYRWDFGDGTISLQETPVHKYQANGSYRVLLTVNGESACIDTVSDLTVYESPLGAVYCLYRTLYTEWRYGRTNDCHLRLSACDHYVNCSSLTAGDKDLSRRGRRHSLLGWHHSRKAGRKQVCMSTCCGRPPEIVPVPLHCFADQRVTSFPAFSYPSGWVRR